MNYNYRFLKLLIFIIDKIDSLESSDTELYKDLKMSIKNLYDELNDRLESIKNELQ